MKNVGLILAATIAVGMFALPATMAYFTGQHEFVDPGSVECAKCHGDIGTELHAGNVHESMACQACHFTTDGTGDNPNTAKTGHASIAVECMDCHDAAIGNFPQAGSLGDHDITASTAAHNNWYEAAMNDDENTPNYGANEVCIACHTMTNIEITWTGAGGNMTFDQNTELFGEI